MSNLVYYHPFQSSTQLTVNPHDVAKEFFNTYYTLMNAKGLHSILYFFDHNATCNYNGKEMIGMYDVMVLLASEFIIKMIYDKLTYTITMINQNTIMMQVIGLVSGVSFWGSITFPYSFSETFIISHIGNNKLVVTGYVFRLI